MRHSFYFDCIYYAIIAYYFDMVSTYFRSTNSVGQHCIKNSMSRAVRTHSKRQRSAKSQDMRMKLINICVLALLKQNQHHVAWIDAKKQ